MTHIPTELEIKDQLSLILSSVDFTSSERLKSFLVYVVEETLSGRGEQLKAYNIAVDVFDLGSDFDSLANSSIRMAAGRLRNKLEHYYFTSNNADKVQITIPKGSYRPLFSYLSSIKPHNYLEIDPEQISEADFLAEDSVPACENKQGNRPTVIVAPFKSISNNRNLEEFLAGLSEEIALALTRFDELSIVNLQPSPAGEIDIWDKVDKIGARFIVGGNAQVGGKDNDNLRLRIYLLDSRNQSQVWAERYESTLNNASLFEIQDEITEQVAARIGDSFGLINRMLLKEQAQKSPADMEIYEAMLYYHHWLLSLTPERFITAKNALQQAIELDPNYATTKAMLSDVYATHCQWGLRIFDNAIDLSLELANQAIELNSNCQYAHWAKAYNCYLRRDEKCFLDSVYRALELNYSNTNILAVAGTKFTMIGRMDEGLEMLTKAFRLNPHIPSWYHSGPFIVHYLYQEYEEALSEAKYITTPNMWGPLMRAATYGMLGQKKEGRAELKTLFNIEPQFKKNGSDTMLLFFFHQSTVDKMMTGLTKAGL